MYLASWIRNWKRSLERRWALSQSIRRKNVSHRRATRPRLEMLEDRWLLSTYIVTSTADSGTGSLRDAINSANATGSTITEIDFNIGTKGTSSGVQIIKPASALPALTANNVFINGHSENQWQGVTSTSPLIELNGASAGTGSDGLQLTGASNTVSGLFITSFTNGIEVGSSAEVGGDNNIIGGTTSGAGNVISGNSSYGVFIRFESGGAVEGNYIGTNAAGTAALPNKVGILDQGNTNTIGGTATGASNIISGNRTFGVVVSGLYVQVDGNYIGTDVTGKSSVPNSVGVEIGGNSDTLGGTAAGAGNVISGNQSEGVYSDSFNLAGYGELIQGNYIGTDVTGTERLSNGGGIYLSASGNNTIGGSVPGARNVISGNTGDGLYIVGSNATGNLVQGNYIGVDATGANSLHNDQDGIFLDQGASTNTIGGISTDARNVISGNLGDGVNITGIPGNYVAEENLVQGNYIGTDATGAKAIPNSLGINVGGNDTTIGGTAAGARNIISGNSTDGVLIGNNVSGLQVQGNYIGTDATGAKAVANSVGIEIDSSNNHNNNNSIGGTSAAARNIISGNSSDGVLLDASGAEVQGNYIGTDVTGTQALANGIGVYASASGDTIDGSVISGNSTDGVFISSGITGVQVQGNYIGTDATGAKALGNSVGVSVAGPKNTIGGTAAGARNIISGNSTDGVLVSATGVRVQANYIGTDVTGAKTVGNSVGVEVAASASVINDGNVISGNTGTNAVGVLIDSGVSGTFVQANYIGTNAAGTSAVANPIGIDDQGTNTTIGAGNVISGNTNQGILMQGSAGLVLGNSIGTDLMGTSAVANGIGIEVSVSAPNTIGGTTGAVTNVVSGNRGAGILIDTVSGVQVQGNFIGTDRTGTKALANSVGIQDSGNNNTLGGTVNGAGNIISGNNNDGVLLSSSASGNLVLGDVIGLDFKGINGVGNAANGVEVAGTSNTIGGPLAGLRNIISGNAMDGILLDSTASANLILGMEVGTDYTGKNAVGNSGNGIEVAGTGNTVGASYAVGPNLISGNSNDGVLLDSGSSGNEVLGNYIGTNYAGTVAVANKVGIEDAGSSNTIGGSVLGDKNVISGNSSDGVLIDSAATKETMQGNYIGTDISGNSALANGKNGVEVQGNNNLIGGNSGFNYFTRNFLSGNTGDGLLIANGATGNQVLGNFIGLGVSGTSGVGNRIGVEIAGTSNTIGGTNAVGTNFISGNNNDGILLDGTASANLIQGTDVGTDYAGRTAVANGGNGIEVMGNGNTIGSTISAARNILSGNSGDGVKIDSGTLILGNFIGLNALDAAVPNAGNGINIAGTNNTIGGTATGARNYISGNSNDGVLLESSASGNVVLGNFLGVNLFSNAAANHNGIEVAGTQNIVGGSASGAFNVISGNTNDGVLLDSTASGNVVLGNNVGQNVYGTVAVGNSIGIEVAGTRNTVGASYAVAPNVLSGNSKDGVLLDSTASGNQVLGNYIGTNHAGTAALANNIGIEDAGSSNILGGSVLGAKNVISGNSGDGILLDSTATKETMQGNYIGLDYSGKSALANGKNGVEVQGSNNTIGGNSGFNYFKRNFLSGNSGDGLLIANGATGNAVQGNFIGVDISGTHGAGNSIGIEVAGTSNTLGGASFGLGNVLSGNSSDGLRLDSLATNNVVQRNYVGTDYTGTSAVGNGGNGVTILSNNNTLGGSSAAAGNTIANNGGDGVLVSVGVGNTITSNSIFANTGVSISLSNGGNNNLAAPSLLSASYSGGVLTVSGNFTVPTANVSYVIQIFASPSSNEGEVYLGSLTVTPANTGTQSFSFRTATSAVLSNPIITATLTDPGDGTSEFSLGISV